MQRHTVRLLRRRYRGHGPEDRPVRRISEHVVQPHGRRAPGERFGRTEGDSEGHHLEQLAGGLGLEHRRHRQEPHAVQAEVRGLQGLLRAERDVDAPVPEALLDHRHEQRDAPDPRALRAHELHHVRPSLRARGRSTSRHGRQVHQLQEEDVRYPD